LIVGPRSGKVLEVNDQFLKMLGYREEDVKKLTFADIVVSEDKAIRADIQRTLESGHDVFGLRRYKRANGSVLDVEVAATLIKHGDEQVVMVNVRDVSERIRAEKAIKESEDRYRTIFETTGCATIMTEEDMTVSLANTEFEKLSGYTKEEIQGKMSWIEFLQPNEVERLARYHYTRRIDSKAAPSNYEFQFLKRSGETRTVLATVALIPGSSKTLLSLLDITDRERAERALRESERRYRDLFEGSTDAIYVNALNGQFIDCNQPMLDLFGYTREEMLRLRSVDFYVRPRERDEFQKAVMEAGAVKDYEIRLRKKDGTEIDCLLSTTLWRSSDGRILGYQGMVRDITKRKKAEEALRATKDELEHMVAERTAALQDMNEKLVAAVTRGKRVEDMLRKGAERYRNLFENSPIGIYRTKPDGRILMANPTFVRMLGFSSFSELNANNIDEDDYEPNYLNEEFRDRVAREGRVRGYEASWKRADGTVIFVRENAKAIRAEDGTLLYYEGTVEDITEQKMAEKRIRNYQEELRSLASELSLAEERERRRIASILHDHIGQLLAVSKIKLGSLLETAEKPGIRFQVNEVRQLVEQAIKYTRSLTSELSPPILYELGFEAALEWLGERMQEQHGFTLTFESDNEPKSVDEEAGIFLFTSVRELLVNIAKHAGASSVRVSVRKNGEDIVIEVEDDGVGFSTTEADWRSGGFGLFSIRERLQHVGGLMEINSSPGSGTLIKVSAPSKMKKKSTRRG
jgi:PAS domain S-box-containing protein